jgi:hypothetical protein
VIYNTTFARPHQGSLTNQGAQSYLIFPNLGILTRSEVGVTYSVHPLSLFRGQSDGKPYLICLCMKQGGYNVRAVQFLPGGFHDRENTPLKTAWANLFRNKAVQPQPFCSLQGTLPLSSDNQVLALSRDP